RARARGDLPAGVGLRDGARRPLGRRVRPQAAPEAREGVAGLALHPHALRDRLPVRAGARRAARGRLDGARRAARARAAPRDARLLAIFEIGRLAPAILFLALRGRGFRSLILTVALLCAPAATADAATTLGSTTGSPSTNLGGCPMSGDCTIFSVGGGP